MTVASIATQAGIQTLRAEIREVELRLRAEVAGLRTEMQSLRAELIRWVVGVGIAAVIATGGMIITLGVAILRALPHPYPSALMRRRSLVHLATAFAATAVVGTARGQPRPVLVFAA